MEKDTGRKMTDLKGILDDTQSEKQHLLDVLRDGKEYKKLLRNYFNLSHSLFDKCKRQKSLFQPNSTYPTLMREDPQFKLFGTTKNSYIWCNSSDSNAVGFAIFVWCSILFSFITTLIVLVNDDIGVVNATLIILLILLALWSHAKTMLSDPGAIPPNAMPLVEDSELGQILCGRCECYKAPFSHHGMFILNEFLIVYPFIHYHRSRLKEMYL
jgi:hypothetical protein